VDVRDSQFEGRGADDEVVADTLRFLAALGRKVGEELWEVCC
jgi:hypothetical protein